MSVRFLHVADLHLGRKHSFLGGKAAERQAEADGVLGRIVDLALDPARNIAGLLIAGDLFESHEPDEELVGSVIGHLRRMVDYGRFVLTVPGNHDEYTYPTSVYRRHADAWPGVLVRNPASGHVHSCTVGGTRFHFYSMAYTAALSKEPYDEFTRIDEPGRHVGVFHASLDPGWRDRSITLRGEKLAKIGLDYLALGHIHVPSRGKAGDTVVVYPGAPEGNSFSDPGVDHLTLVEFTEKHVVVHHEKFRTRTIRSEDVDLTGMHDGEALQEAIGQLVFPEVILQVRLVGQAGFEINVDYLRGLFAPRCHHFDIVDASEAICTQRIATMAADRTIRGLFIQRVRDLQAQAQDDDERRMLELALRHGMAAFAEESS